MVQHRSAPAVQLGLEGPAGLLVAGVEPERDVRADPEALSGADLLAIGLAGVVLGVVLPLVGAPLGAWALARGRSARVRPWLSRALPPVQAAVPPRIETEGRGESDPSAPNDSEQNRAQNRRVEMAPVPKPRPW